MKITKRQLKRIIQEEIEQLDYELGKDTTDMMLDEEYPEDVEAQEDSWAGGQNIHWQVDHSEAGGGDPQTRGIEVMKITESQLRRLVLKEKQEIIAEEAKLSAKYDEDKHLTPLQGKKLPDDLQKAIIDKAEEEEEEESKNESFDFKSYVRDVINEHGWHDDERGFETMGDMKFADAMDYEDQDEEDVEEMARYHALNDDKDEMLYMDNPDYRMAWDDAKGVYPEDEDSTRSADWN